MPLLFSYGTLQREDVQFTLFGRSLAGCDDQLLGFELSSLRVADEEFAQTSGTVRHAVVRPTPCGKVLGVVFALTDAELAQVDEYEPAEYTRVLASLESGGKAWVYVEASVGPAGHESSDG